MSIHQPYRGCERTVHQPQGNATTEPSTQPCSCARLESSTPKTCASVPLTRIDVRARTELDRPPPNTHIKSSFDSMVPRTHGHMLPWSLSLRHFRDGQAAPRARTSAVSLLGDHEKTKETHQNREESGCSHQAHRLRRNAAHSLYRMRTTHRPARVRRHQRNGQDALLQA